MEGGGWVDFNRVNGALAMSRALGDFFFKQNLEAPLHKQIVTGWYIWLYYWSNSIISHSRCHDQLSGRPRVCRHRLRWHIWCDEQYGGCSVCSISTSAEDSSKRGLLTSLFVVTLWTSSDCTAISKCLHCWLAVNWFTRLRQYNCHHIICKWSK